MQSFVTMARADRHQATQVGRRPRAHLGWGLSERRKRGKESGWWAVTVEREVRSARVKLVGREQQEQKQGV